MEQATSLHLQSTWCAQVYCNGKWLAVCRVRADNEADAEQQACGMLPRFHHCDLIRVISDDGSCTPQRCATCPRLDVHAHQTTG